MEFYYLFIFTFTGALGYSIYFFGKRRADPILVDWLEWLGNHKKRILFSWLGGFVLITLVCINPLWKTTKCRYYQFSYNTVTKQDWVLGQCLYKTKTGAWLPLVVTRDSPDGSEHVERPDDAVEVH